MCITTSLQGHKVLPASCESMAFFSFSLSKKCVPFSIMSPASGQCIFDRRIAYVLLPLLRLCAVENLISRLKMMSLGCAISEAVLLLNPNYLVLQAPSQISVDTSDNG